MKSLIPILLGALALLPAAAQADDATPNAQAQHPAGQQGCGLASGALVSQGQGEVTINCVGVTEEFGGQLAGILTYVLQRRLDPEIVIAKLDEIKGVPRRQYAAQSDRDQGQAIVQSLSGGKPATITVVADPDGTGCRQLCAGDRDAARHGRLADRRQPDQPHRPAGLEDIRGLVLVVHDEKAPPAKAVELKRRWRRRKSSCRSSRATMSAPARRCCGSASARRSTPPRRNNS